MTGVQFLKDYRLEILVVLIHVIIQPASQITLVNVKFVTHALFQIHLNLQHPKLHVLMHPYPLLVMEVEILLHHPHLTLMPAFLQGLHRQHQHVQVIKLRIQLIHRVVQHVLLHNLFQTQIDNCVFHKVYVISYPTRSMMAILASYATPARYQMLQMMAVFLLLLQVV